MDTVVDKFHTYDSAYLDDLVVDLAMLVEPSNSVTWSLFQDGGFKNATTVKWYDAVTNTLEGTNRGGWNATDLVSLGIDDDLAAIINVGDVLEANGEQVVVSEVTSRSTGAATISVHERGHGGTTATTHTNGDAIYIVGNANVEGTVDGDAILEDNVERKNYMQLVEEIVELTLTAKNAKYEDVEDKMNEARVKALSRATKKLNLSALLGSASEPTAGKPGAAGGLRYYIRNATNGIRTNVAGTFTETAFKATLLEVAKRGGNPNAFICSPDVKSTINGFNGSYTMTSRDERTAGQIVDYYEAEGVGRIAIIADPLLRHSFGVGYVVNTRKMAKYWFEEDALRFEEEPSNSRSRKETLQGQASFKIKDVETDFAEMYGIT